MEMMKLQSVKKGGFFACYLLTSLSPLHQGQTYIGFTVDPKRRIRQHNGEIGSGALRTKRKRPWEMIMCIYGFPTNVSALQFEWAWQHPKKSLAVRMAAADLKYLSGVANKIRLAYTMLALPSWRSLNLTVNFFSTKYSAHCANCSCLPDHMKVQVQPMDNLPCYDANCNCSFEDEYDVSDGDELSHPGSPTVVVPEDLDASSGSSSYDQRNEDLDAESDDSSYDQHNGKAENDTLSDPGQGKQLSVSSATGITSNSSLDGRQILETCASSQQLPIDAVYSSILDETSTWDSYGFSQRNIHPYNLHDLRMSRSAVLCKRRDPCVNVNDLSACRSYVVKSTPASRIIASSAEVEVIDLMTPSQDCRVRILSKKKRDPSILDLVRFPNFSQLFWGYKNTYVLRPSISSCVFSS